MEFYSVLDKLLHSFEHLQSIFDSLEYNSVRGSQNLGISADLLPLGIVYVVVVNATHFNFCKGDWHKTYTYGTFGLLPRMLSRLFTNLVELWIEFL